MLETFMNIINLFFVPTITIYLLYRKREIDKFSKLNCLLEYCISSIAVAVITKGIIAVYRFLFKSNILTSSSVYTVIAIVVAMLIAYLVQIVEVKYVNKNKQKNTKEKEEKQEETDEESK